MDDNGLCTALLDSYVHTHTHTHSARITSLDTLKISHVCCGHAHSLALTDQGQLYSWGEDTHGQLGLGSSKMTPKFAPK